MLLRMSMPLHFRVAPLQRMQTLKEFGTRRVAFWLSCRRQSQSACIDGALDMRVVEARQQ